MTEWPHHCETCIFSDECMSESQFAITYACSECPM